MIDHSSVGVPAIAAARKFYDRLLASLGCRCLAADERLAAYGQDRPAFLLLTPFDGGGASAGNGAHVAFKAASREVVEAFHAAGLAAGGSDEGRPGVRDAYPMPNVYAAYIRDPFGNKLEAVHGGFSAPA